MEENDLLERLSAIRTTFTARKQDTMLEYKVSAAKFSLNQLKVEESQLIRRLDKLKARINRIHTNRYIPEDEDDLSDFAVSFSGGFFNQLRAYEALLEKLTSRRDGIQSQVRNLKSGVSETIARQKRAMREAQKLRDQLPDVEARGKSLSTTCQVRTSELTELEFELVSLKDECEAIKQSIQSKVVEMKQTTPQQITNLLTQKATLEAAVKRAREDIVPLRIQSAQQLSANKVSQKDRERKLKDMASPIQWMSERVALIGKIKRARAEIGQMRNRERSAVRATENISHRTLTDAEIRNAIIAETESLPQTVSQFYEDTMETEREYQTELRHDLEEIDRAIRQAETNSSSVLELLRRQDAIAVQSDRIDGLKLELDEVRAQLA